MRCSGTTPALADSCIGGESQDLTWCGAVLVVDQVAIELEDLVISSAISQSIAGNTSEGVGGFDFVDRQVGPNRGENIPESKCAYYLF